MTMSLEQLDPDEWNFYYNNTEININDEFNNLLNK